jgi:hypothetical protein
LKDQKWHEILLHILLLFVFLLDIQAGEKQSQADLVSATSLGFGRGLGLKVHITTSLYSCLF